MKKKNKVTFSKDYYRMRFMTTDPTFITMVEELRSRYARYGRPIPKDGFSNSVEYGVWADQILKMRSAMENSDDMREKIKKITKGAERFGFEESCQIDRLKDEILPPVPGEVIRNLITDFGFDPKERKLRNFIEGHIFLGQHSLKEQRFAIRWSRNTTTKEAELLIKVFPTTKKQDIVDNWHLVAEEQKNFKNYIGKDKEWVTFNRDAEIYRYWAMFQNEDVRPIDKKIEERLMRTYPDLTLGQIRKSIARIRALFKKNC